MPAATKLPCGLARATTFSPGFDGHHPDFSSVASVIEHLGICPAVASPMSEDDYEADDCMDDDSEADSQSTSDASSSDLPKGPAAPSAPGKRRRDSPGPEPPGAKRAKASAPAPKKRKDQIGEQHLKVVAKAVPKAARTIVAALYLHIRILWGIIAPAAVPSLPSDGDIATFDQRYTSIDQVLALRNSPNVRTPSNNNMVQKIVELRADFTSTSARAKQASRVPETALRFMLGQLAKYGLRAWRPNFNEGPYSLYNSTHRFVALDTFRQLVVSLAYDHMAVDKAYLDQMLLLTQVYDHYVHFRIFKIWEREQKYPGAAQAEMERDTILARRRKTANERGDFLDERGYPKWVVELIGNPEATSDDEEGRAKIGGKVMAVLWIREKEERADIFTKLVRWIDQRIAELKQLRTRRGPVNSIKQATGAERIRIVCPKRKLSEEPLPVGIALDYYDVDIFNSLDYSFRALFADKATIAMPDKFNMLTASPDDPESADKVAWRLLTQAQWMEQFGKERLKAYRVPAAEGIQVGQPAGGSGGGGGSGGSEEEPEEIVVDDAMASDQARFAAAAKRALPQAAPVAPRTGVPGRLAAGKGKERAAPPGGGASPSAPATRRTAASSSTSRFSAGSGPASGSGSRGTGAGSAGAGTGGATAGTGAGGTAAGTGADSGDGSEDEILVLDDDIEMIDEDL
ncbi:hypothetical protein AURDEDRAFT_173635 [Auricularia subglabra TFB-10046 SS5]|uniref:Uncharacterized protein n=1 Tax=Auricularia subglabra (strain TFB-10046 / SS5) TaxID=717982 RepID=J0LHE5_AURST|nr:hypothetical protein AURDEDRAFT_173635 [Auricularia subglabra TFB-10046 SS5]